MASDSTVDTELGEPAGLLAELGTQIALDVGSWFPEQNRGPVAATLTTTENRPRCFLHRVTLEQGRTQRKIVVKVRHSDVRLRRSERFPDRPILRRERVLPDAEAARREYDGLVLIHDMLSNLDDNRFGRLRPLCWLPEHHAIAMDEISEPTLRDRVVANHRLHLLRTERSVVSGAVGNAGAWLRQYHDASHALRLTDDYTSRDDAMALCQRFCSFLGDHTGRRPFFAMIAEAALSRAADVLPPRLPLRTGHGDFVSRNIFVADTGRVIIFDPLPLYRQPIYEDLARFVMAGLRLIQGQAWSLGLLLSAHDLARYEDTFLRSYFHDGPVPGSAVRFFQLLLLLDKWTELLSKSSLRGSRYRHAAAVELAQRFYAREARRLTTAPFGDPP